MAMTNKIISQQLVQDLFEYKEGELYWKVAKAQRLKVGDLAGTLINTGRKSTKINNKLYLNHRIIFLMFHGYLPKFIDHIDNNPLNNKIENLREATFQQNQWNMKKPLRNTSGSKNVSWYKPTKKWRVQLIVNKKTLNLGYYKDLELADLVAQEARNKYYGEYARDH
jgi:hypothetical protein